MIAACLKLVLMTALRERRPPWPMTAHYPHTAWTNDLASQHGDSAHTQNVINCSLGVC